MQPASPRQASALVRRYDGRADPRRWIKDSGFQSTFLYFGLGQGLIIVILAFFLFPPKTGQVPAVTQNANVIQTRRNYGPTEVIRHPIFWLMYFMFVIVGAGGLMVTANLKPIAADWKIDNVPVTLMAMTMTTVTFAATIDRVLNGLTRPFFGWISDMIGRENTMFIAFGIEGVGIYALYLWGHDPVWFVLLSGFVFFRLGQIYFRYSHPLARTPLVRDRDNQRRPALHSQGYRRPAGARRELHAAVLRNLGQRVPDCGRRKYSRLLACGCGAQAVAANRGRKGLDVCARTAERRKAYCQRSEQRALVPTVKSTGRLSGTKEHDTEHPRGPGQRRSC